MKKSARLLILFISMIMIAATFATPAAAAKDQFKGVWVSTDIDGSSQRLIIASGRPGTNNTYYLDNGATICGLAPDGSFLYAASARGPLSRSGNVLSGNLPVYCHTHPRTFWGNFTFTYTYDASSDTLTDSLGVVWYRG